MAAPEITSRIVDINRNKSNGGCGIFGWRPRRLQRFATPNAFFGIVCACLMVEVASHTGYVGAVLTTIEKNFQLKSSESAFITVINHIGAFTSIVTSYIGSKTHRPRFIALGVFIIGLGQFTCGLPHFFTDSAHPTSVLSNKTYTVCGSPRIETKACNVDVENPSSNPSSAGSNLSKAWLLILGELITGIGSGPVIPLMITYIDDCVGKAKVSVYVGILFACAAGGPIFGWLLGSLTLSYHVDFDRQYANPSIKSSDPGWVGAWWLGFLILGAVMMLMAPVICLFPKEMSTQQKVEPQQHQNSDETSNHKTKSAQFCIAVSGYFGALKRLLTNIPFIFVTFSTTFIVVSGLGQFYFGAKYLETQFRLSTWAAPLILGAILLPTTLFGILLGSYLVKRWGLTNPPKKGALMSASMGSVATLAFFLLLFLGCDHNSNIAGMSALYPGQRDFGSVSRTPLRKHRPVSPNTHGYSLNNECNSKCLCSERDLDFICGSDGVTYASPCFAGCRSRLNETIFQNCSCIPQTDLDGNPSTYGGGLATLGECIKGYCYMLIPYVLIVPLGSFFLALCQNPNYMVTLRTVEQHDRAIGLGLSNVVMRLLGNLLGPIYYGAAIDSSCLKLETDECGQTGACFLYGLRRYRFVFAGMLFAFAAIHSLCAWIAYHSLKRQTAKNQRQHSPLEEQPVEVNDSIAFAELPEDAKADIIYPL